MKEKRDESKPWPDSISPGRVEVPEGKKAEKEIRTPRQSQIRGSGSGLVPWCAHFYDLFIRARAVPSTGLHWRSVTDPAPQKPILVALGSDAQALTLIHTTFWTARETARPWVAVHVEVNGGEEAEETDQARLWLEEAQSLGAETLWITARTLISGMLEAIWKTEATEVILGRGKDRWPWGRLGHSSAQELVRRQPAARVTAIPLGPEISHREKLPPKGRRLGALFGSLGILLSCVGLGSILPPEQPLPAVFLLFLLGTALIAQQWGLIVGAVAVGASAISFDLVFDSARGSLTVGDWPLLALFLVILAGGQFAVALSERLAQQTRGSRRRAALLAALLLLGRNLAKASTTSEVAEALAHLGERLLHHRILLLLPSESGRWITFPEESAPIATLDLNAETILEKSRIGGLEPIFDGEHAYLLLGHGESMEGALCIAAQNKNALDEEAWELLRAFALQVALALERLRWLENAQQSRMENETERMRSALLGAISHDLRTPLAGIQGAASSLLMAPETLPESTRRDLLSMIHGESERLSQLLTNLLDLTRLEGGMIRVQKEWHPLDEVVGAALRRAESGQGPMQVEVMLPEDLPLVPVDGALLEQLLINLLHNAQRHAPESPVTLRAWAAEESIELEVADRGPGIPEGFRLRVFDKFFRVPGRTRDGGVGLGLAICDAIARAHGGRIWAEAQEDSGACFRVSLPLEDRPPAMPEDEKVLQ